MQSALTSPGINGWGSYSGFAGGGVVISNYIDDNLQEHGTSAYQLSVPKSNGSTNFAVVYCDASISFSDGVAREIRSMDVGPTTYQLKETVIGGYGASLAEEGELYVTITGYNGEQETGSYTLYMAKDGNILTDWSTINLTSLGKVTKLIFTMDGSDRSSWGVKHPKYFAFDNVVVKF